MSALLQAADDSDLGVVGLVSLHRRHGANLVVACLLLTGKGDLDVSVRASTIFSWKALVEALHAPQLFYLSVSV